MEPFIYLVLLVFIGLVFLVFGNLMSKNIYNPLIYLLFWIVYTITVLTLVNSGINLYTYLVINKKQVQPGERGPPGPDGDVGDTGECENNCRIKQYIKKIMKDLELKYNDILKKARGKEESPRRKINNKFIKETITRICTSNQFKEIAQSRNIDDLIKYLTEVFKRWFDILAKADRSNNKKNLENYMEIYGEIVEWEFITNPVNNPFGEIEKYDIYYWGLNKDFRPIPISSCKTKSEAEIGRNKIKALKTNIYNKIYTDAGTRANLNLNLWLSSPININNETYLPLGVIGSSGPQNAKRYIQNLNYNDDMPKEEFSSSFEGPAKSNVLVSTQNNDLVRRPPKNAWDLKWEDTPKKVTVNPGTWKYGNYRGKKVSFWNAKDFEEDGKKFKCFGGLAVGNRYTNPTDYYGRDNVPIVCLNSDILEEVPNKRNFVWNDRGSYVRRSSSVYENNDDKYNLAYFVEGHRDDPTRKFYKIKPEFLTEGVVETDTYNSKNLVNNSKAIGFQVQKYNRHRSEGLFDLLDLVIESDIQSYQTNIQSV
jgi:hypothetical protein